MRVNTLLEPTVPWESGESARRLPHLVSSHRASRGALSGRTVCLSLSVLTHIGILGTVALLPERTAAATLATVVEVELIQPPPALPAATPRPELPPPPASPPQKPVAVPRGRLDEAQRVAPSETPPPAPPTAPVLTDSNPYSNATFSHFTAGTATPATPVTKTATTTGAASAAGGFGVERGDASVKASAELDSWYRSVRSRLLRQASSAYPLRARRLQQEGTARLSVSIGQSGAILSVALAQTSGHDSLDQAAVSSLQSVGSVPAPPAGVGTTNLSVPVDFRLD